ncbi:hypothetical protein [Rheinheimera baltica]|uniref:hypothetical protein n=1 Tax=Rheinheimera baltica TaxID=67576 RepID=UPI00273EBB40|nr:hypothetical protein [Rheinheimera baltica]MDP5190915.1 hypothetical protein [Rheinheimera baltica]
MAEVNSDVLDAINKFQFSEALKSLDNFYAKDDYIANIQRVKLLFLTGQPEHAIKLVNGSASLSSENLTEVVFSGLIINHRFSEAAELVLKNKHLPPNANLLTKYLQVLVELDLLDEAGILLKKTPMLFQSSRRQLLLRLATRLLIAGQDKTSYWVYSQTKCYWLQNTLPTQLPWLMLIHGDGSEANKLLALQAQTSPSEVILKHFHYLKSEYTELFNILNSKLSFSATKDDDQFKDNRFSSFLENKLSPKYNDGMYIDLTVWHCMWKSQSKNLTLEDYYFQHAKIQLMSNIAAEELTTRNAIDTFMKDYCKDIKNVIDCLYKTNQSFILITSHLSYPGGLFPLFSEFQDLHFVRNPASGVSIKEEILRPIYFGPSYMKKSNLTEFHRLVKILKSGGKAIMNLDQQVISSKDRQKYGSFGTSYNFFLADIIWELKIKCFYIDTNYNGNQYEYMLEALPCTESYANIEDWKYDLINTYDQKTKSRISENSFLNNPLGGHIPKHVLKKKYGEDIKKIKELLMKQ